MRNPPIRLGVMNGLIPSGSGGASYQLPVTSPIHHSTIILHPSKCLRPIFFIVADCFISLRFIRNDAGRIRPILQSRRAIRVDR
ncbi:MAG: hypothetical protein AB7U05_14280 [Mangrovibacterium sp.]